MLTRAEAMLQLKGMVAWTTEPTLSEDDLTALLTRAAVADSAGLAPRDDDWEPTYSPVMLNASAAEGWRWKAGRLTADKNGSKGENSFDPKAQRDDMMALAKDYQSRVQGSQQVHPFRDLRTSERISGVVLN